MESLYRKEMDHVLGQSIIQNAKPLQPTIQPPIRPSIALSTQLDDQLLIHHIDHTPRLLPLLLGRHPCLDRAVRLTLRRWLWKVGIRLIALRPHIPLWPWRLSSVLAPCIW